MRRQRPPALGTHNVGDFAEYPLQPNMRRRRALGLQQHALQVVAVEGARQKILTVGILQRGFREA